MNDQLATMVQQVRAFTLPGAGSLTGNRERLAAIGLLEDLRDAVAAAQARLTADFAREHKAERVAAGAPAREAGRGVAAEIALAKRISPHRAQRYVGWSTILTTELPETFAALRAGVTSEWRAMLIARETAPLTRAQREIADRELARQLPGSGDRQVEAAARKTVCRLDPAGAVERTRNAAGDRRVSIRPAPDTMVRVTALLPVAPGVAAYAALARAADTAIATGDPVRDGRSRGQVMADTFVERLTGQSRAEQVPVEVTLIMTDETLLARGAEPAVVVGHGQAGTAIPAGIARDLALTGDAPTWLRRLYTAPGGRELVAMDSRRRRFTRGQQRFITARDQGTCRTPYCGAPIRHYDHVTAAARGGRTSVANGQGLCAACNYAKEALLWRHRVLDEQVVIDTPNGRRVEHRPPAPPRRERSPVEHVLLRCVDLEWRAA